MTLAKVARAIQHLNTTYGYGDVINVKLFLDGRIEFTVKSFRMKAVKRIGRFEGDTVYALKHHVTFDGQQQRSN